VKPPPPRRVGAHEWAALREAAPSFAPRWEAFRASERFAPTREYTHLAQLAEHVLDKLASGDESEFPALFAAFDQLYRQADNGLEQVLRIGLIEDLLVQAQRRGLDAWLLTRHMGLPGRDAWAEAYVWLRISRWPDASYRHADPPSRMN